MLRGLLLLLAATLAGDALVAWVGGDVPGPVVGLVLVLGALGIRPRLRAWVEPAAGPLLDRLGLWFVPAGVGVVALGAVWKREGWALLVGASVSTLVALGVTGLVATRLLAGPARRDDEVT